MHILIIGAGPAGLAIAQCLRKEGISYQIFDRDAHQDARFQGYSISVHTVIKDFLELFPSDMPDFETATSNLLPLKIHAQINVHYPTTENRLGVEVVMCEPDYPYIRVERARLRRWLLTNLDVQWNMHAVQFEHGDDGVTVHFQDGRVFKGDLLIGADGANSKIREHLLKRPNHESLRSCPISTISGELELCDEPFRRQLELSHSAYNSVSRNPRYVMLHGLHYVYADGRSGKFYWDYFEEDDNVDDPNHWLRTATQQEKLDYVLGKVRSSLPPRLCEAIELTPVDGIVEKYHLWKDFRPSADILPNGRCVLVGDAAHVMAPFRGLGGFNAFTDAIKLSRGLIKLHRGGQSDRLSQVENTMAVYHEEMIARAQEAVHRSREGTKYAIDTAWFMECIVKWAPWGIKMFLDWLDPGNKLKNIPRIPVRLPKDP